MASTSTTQIFVAPLLDLVGASATAAREGADRTIFDALLQSPPVFSPAPPPTVAPVVEEVRDRRATQESPARDTPNAQSAPRPSASAGVEDLPSENEISESVDAPVGNESVALPEFEDLLVAEGLPLQEDDAPLEVLHNDNKQQLVAEALAGLAAIVVSPAELPAAQTAEDVSKTFEQVIALEGERNRPSVKRPLGRATLEANRAIANQSGEINAVDPIATTGEQMAASREGQLAPLEAVVDVEPNLATTDAALVAAEAIAAQEIQTAEIAAVSASDATKTEAPKANESKSGERQPSSESQLPPQEISAAANATQAPQVPEAPTNAPPIAAITAPTAPAGAQSASTAREPGINSVAPPATRPRTSTDALLARPEASGRRGPVSVDTTRLLHRVARAVATAQSQNGEIQLRLSPPELGSLKLQVQVVEGALSVRCEAETSAARTALLDNLPALRERLAEQGVRIERFDVDLMQRQGSGTPDRPHDQERGTPTPSLRGELTREGRAASVPDRPIAAPAESPGRLNVII